MGAHTNLQIVWFKRDLRVEDHRALAMAAQAGPVLPLFIIEPDLWQADDMSARQWSFVEESLNELRSDLAGLGQPLIVRIGNAVEILARAVGKLKATALWSHEETGNGWTYARDIAVGRWAKSEGLPWHEIRQNGVFRKLKTRNGWAKKWDAQMAEPITAAPSALPPLDGIDPGPIPTAAELGLDPDPCPERQMGGRREGFRHLDSFLYERGAPYRRAMSSPAEGAVHCSRISPYLAWGALSMREVAQATWNRQRQLKADGIKGGWRGSMSSFQGRLHWRDHFTQKLEDEPSLEFRNLHRAYDGLRPSEPDAARLHAWSVGETGLPFVDACMRCLNATGWMNFRIRAMLMAVASYHLWLDWRTTGLHLARKFTDYEAGIHWPQVQMQSGTTGINTIRIYNPVKQGKDQDPTGAFIRKWVPELADLSNEDVHEPWAAPLSSALLGKSYPFPIVDYLSAAKDAREKVWAVRKGSGFRRKAEAIQDKHGSRKSGIPMRGRETSKSKTTTDPANQLDLPLSPAGEAG